MDNHTRKWRNDVSNIPYDIQFCQLYDHGIFYPYYFIACNGNVVEHNGTYSMDNHTHIWEVLYYVFAYSWLLQSIHIVYVGNITKMSVENIRKMTDNLYLDSIHCYDK